MCRSVVCRASFRNFVGGVAFFPGPRLQYGKAGEGLVHFLTVSDVTGRKPVERLVPRTHPRTSVGYSSHITNPRERVGSGHMTNTVHACQKSLGNL